MKQQHEDEVILEIMSSIKKVIQDVKSNALEIERFDLQTSQVIDSSGLTCTVDLRMVLRRDAQ